MKKERKKGEEKGSKLEIVDKKYNPDNCKFKIQQVDAIDLSEFIVPEKVCLLLSSDTLIISPILPLLRVLPKIFRTDRKSVV